MSTIPVRAFLAAGTVMAAFALAGCTAQPATTPDTSTTVAPTTTSSEVVTLTTSASPAPQDSTPVTTTAPPPPPAQEEPPPVLEEPATTSEPNVEYHEPSTTEESEEVEWIDPTYGWLSQRTIDRALAAGIPWGGQVYDYMRCGTVCGEEPTSGELQQRYMDEHPTTLTPTSEPQQQPLCPDLEYPSGGICHPYPPG